MTAPTPDSSPEPRKPRWLANPFGLNRKDRLVMLGVTLLALVPLVFFSTLLLRGPPSRLVMSTGLPDGAYHAFGKRYQEILARSGVELVLVPSTGALENISRLRSGAEGVSIALVQGGLSQAGDEANLMSLGAVSHEPIWVFFRSDSGIHHLGELSGLRVAAGVEGSGTMHVARTLLLHGSSRPTMVPLGGLAAARALENGEVDAAFYVSAPEAPSIQRLLHAPGITLLNNRRAEAYVRHFPIFNRIEIPEAGIDLDRSLPAEAVQMLSLKAELVARRDLDPVLVDLMVEAAREVHGSGGLVRRAGEFPSLIASEYPASPDAERYYKSGTSVLRRYLPPWAATWLQRIFLLGLPIVALGFPLVRALPGVYRWGMRRRVYRYYGELSLIERAVAEGKGDREAQLKRLDHIAGRISEMPLPLSFASDAYNLRTHVLTTRDFIESGAIARARAR